MHRPASSSRRSTIRRPFMFLILLIFSVSSFCRNSSAAVDVGQRGDRRRAEVGEEELQAEEEEQAEEKDGGGVHVYVDYWRDGYHRAPAFTRPRPGPINSVKRPSPSLKP